MAAVDALPGLEGAAAAGEFVSPRRSRRLAKLVFVYSLLAVVLGYMRARGLHSVTLSLPAFVLAVAASGVAIRSARLRVDRGGVRWGWDSAGFRVDIDRLVEVRAYRDAVAVVPRRGSTWYLVRRDWMPFSGLPEALERAGIGVVRYDGRAPFMARLQGYGRVLDGILLFNAALATVLLVF